MHSDDETKHTVRASVLAKYCLGDKRRWRVILLAGGLASTAGCRDAPTWLDVFGTARIEPPTAEGRSYPNLAAVPVPRPERPASLRQADAATLAADRDSARAESSLLHSADTPPATAAVPPPSGAVAAVVGFPVGESRLSPQALQQIASVAEQVKTGSTRIRVVGDAARARLVGDELVRQGVAAARISFVERQGADQVEIFVDS